MSIKSSKSSVLRAINSIKEGQTGEYKPLKTRFKHLNEKLHGGIPRQKIITIGALSSFGKSHNLRQIEEDIFNEDLNPNSKNDVILIKADFEMSKEEHIASKVHEKTGRSFKDILYSKPDKDIQKAFNEVYLELASNHIYETFDTYSPDNFYNEVVEFLKPFINEFTEEIVGYKDDDKTIPIYAKNKSYKKQIILTIDNINLIDTDNSDESKAISKLITHLIKLKRNIKTLSIIILAQLNRELKQRINPKEHFPRTSDFYYSSKIEHASDIQIVIHIPYLLGYTEYGAVNYERFEYLSEYLEEKNKYAYFRTKGLAFWHYVKVRIKGDMKNFRDVFVEEMYKVDENDTEVYSDNKFVIKDMLNFNTEDDIFKRDNTNDEEVPF